MAGDKDHVQKQQTMGPVGSTEETGDKMRRANRAASKMMRSRMAENRPEDLKVLEELKDENVVVVRGQYDRVEDVLSLAALPFKLINPPDVDRCELKPDQILMINCPGQLGDEGIRRVRQFVGEGGYLFTTDWSLLNVLEKAFPGIVKYNGNPTSDDVVEVEVVDKDNPFLDMIMSEKADPNWWLESSSYPIQVLKKDLVRVLLQSREMKSKYGEAPVAVYFQWEAGKVFHITSHFYLQRAETRTERQSMGAGKYVGEELSMSDAAQDALKEDLDGVSVSEIQSAYSMQQFMTNIIVSKYKK